MGGPPRLLCCLFLALSLAAAARTATRHHEWEISYQFTHSGCVRKLAVAINGHTPGPTIRATQGDTVVVRVKNSLLTENVAIHWHGIRQIGTPWADGTEGVTQCPILPGDVFTYTFVVDRPGTYMYHALYGMRRSPGVNGRLIVVAAAPGGADTEPSKHDGEHSVLLKDWWHNRTNKQAAVLASQSATVWAGEPHSLLINGSGKRFNCSATGHKDAFFFEAETANQNHKAPAAATFSSHPVAGQKPVAAEGIITRSAPSDSPPVSGGHSPSLRSPSACSPRRTGPVALLTAALPAQAAPLLHRPDRSSRPRRMIQEPPMALLPQCPVASTVGVPVTEAFVLALLGYNMGILLWSRNGLAQMVHGWSTAAEVLYRISEGLALALTATGAIMAANSDMLSVSAFCIKMGTILSTDLLIVAMSCKYGRWACVPSTAVMTCIMAAVWILGA